MRLRQDYFACGIFVDLKKAFDTIQHIFFKKLVYYSVGGIPNKWFASYLSNRKQFVLLYGYMSNTAAVRRGVPESFILGPLLFLIYIND